MGDDDPSPSARPETDADDDNPAAERFSILVCVDGSDESYRAVRYAEKLGGGVDADIVLLYVRQADQGLRSGGLQVRVARENMLEWGLELPGIKHLKKGLDILAEVGSWDEGWEEKTAHTSVEGDPLGNNAIVYVSEQGNKIVLKVKVAPDLASGILDESEAGKFSMIVLGASKRRRGMAQSLRDPPIAEKIAQHARCSVLVARDLEIGHGHLICLDGSERAREAARRDAYIASRCQCPISLLSVAPDHESEADARRIVDETKAELEGMGIEVVEAMTRVGNPVAEIIEAGAGFSTIVMSDTSKRGLKRLLVGSVAFRVLQDAHNSVLIVR